MGVMVGLGPDGDELRPLGEHLVTALDDAVVIQCDDCFFHHTSLVERGDQNAIGVELFVSRVVGVAEELGDELDLDHVGVQFRQLHQAGNARKRVIATAGH